MVLGLIIMLQLIAVVCFAILWHENKIKHKAIDKNLEVVNNSDILKERLDILTKKLEFFNDGHLSDLTKTTITGIIFWKVTNNINYEHFCFETLNGWSLSHMSTFQFVDICDKFIRWLKNQIESNKITLDKLDKLNGKIEG